MLIRQHVRTPIWPYVVVVLCLFLLSVLASQSWRSNRITSDYFDPYRVSQLEPTSDADQNSTQYQGQDNNADVQPVVAPSRVDAVSNSLVLNSPFPVETPRQVATVTPGVGERITLDFSIKDSPTLPQLGTPTAAPLATPATDHSADPVLQQDVTPGIDLAEPVTEPSSAEAPAEIPRVFPYSRVLNDEYERLATEPLCRTWSHAAIRLLDQLNQSQSLVSPDTTKLLKQLASHAQQANRLVEQTQRLSLRADILRVGYATLRRTDLWLQLQKVVATGGDTVPVARMNNIAAPLAAVEQRFRETSHSQDWRKYLLLDEISQYSRGGDEALRRQTARRVLKRMESPKLTEKQAEVFRNPPFDAFHRELCQWAYEPIDYSRLLANIEAYESTRSTGDASLIAGSYDLLRWSNQPEVEKFTELLNVHYRNSNVRVALTSEFLNRMLPAPQQIQENIVDSISGADVYGTANTLNQLQVVLVPDGNNWRIGLEAHGEVASDTAASKGPATFYNQGLARYHARKLLLIDRRGIRVWRAEAVADSETELTGFETDFDGLPLIGWLARSMARQQHDEHYYDAKAEAEAKLEHRATTRFDEEVHARLAEAEKQVNQKLIQPFEKIDLKPTPLDLRTTEQRIIARYRLAGDLQLGAHSPRPQAPGDSLISVQVHESALNNTLTNLKLEGKRTELKALYRELAATFDRTELQVPDDVPDNVIVQFADQEAVRVLCEDGRVTLTLRFAELKSGRDFRCRNFAVRAYYVPDAQQLTANLVRDGIIELMGEGLSNKRIILRGIFNKVLAKSRGFNIVNKKLAENPRLHDVRVNQFVINDGWIGVAMGPTRAGDLEHLAKEKQSRVER